MRRPPRLRAAAIRSMAWAICGRACFTARATFASSALMTRAISNELFKSRADSIMATRAISCASTPRLQRLGHRIVEPGLKLLDGLIGAIRPGAVGGQGDGQRALGIYPQGSSGVAQVSERASRKILPRLRR